MKAVRIHAIYSCMVLCVADFVLLGQTGSLSLLITKSALVASSHLTKREREQTREETIYYAAYIHSQRNNILHPICVFDT